MSQLPTDTSTREGRLQQALLGYLQALDAGKTPDRDELLRRHPDLGDDLRAFFADQDRVERLAMRLRLAGGGGPPLGNVRYFGDYELLEEIGRGGMGVVCKARQVSLNRTVAVKMIRSGNLADAVEVQRFRQEAEHAANLDHPNIVPIYEVGDHNGQHYFSMKLIDGPSLAAHLERLRSQPREAAELLAVVARAVHHAHERGLLHRDLKPSNILIDSRGQPQVLDFGLARRLGGERGLTQSGAVVGTPSYISPEQAAGETRRLAPAADVYSLGAILFECLTGQPPFRAETPLGTVLQVINQEPPHPRSLNRKADRDLETICLKCLAKDPASRYRSALALAEDLERWLRGEPIRARRAGVAERCWKRLRRSWAITFVWVLLSVVALFVFLCLGLATAWYLMVARAREAVVVEADRAEHAALMARQLAEMARLEQEKAERAAIEERERSAEARFRAERLLYAQQIAQAQREWEADNAARALQLLDQNKPASLTWEWRYLRRLASARGGAQPPETSRVLGQPGRVWAFAFSPDGKRIATAGPESSVRLFQVDDGKETQVLKGETGEATCVSFSPDGSRVAAGGRFGFVRVWDAAGKEVLVLRSRDQEVRCVSFSPDGKWLAAGGHGGVSPGEVKVWDAASGNEAIVLRGHTGAVTAIAFSPDGKRRLASAGSDGTVRWWDTATGAEVIPPSRHGNEIHGLAWGPDGTRLATAGHDGVVRVWDTATGREVWTARGHAGDVLGVAYSPDGLRLASVGRDDVLRLWDTATGQEVMTLRGARRNVAFSPDGTRLAAIDKEGSLRGWEAGPP